MARLTTSYWPRDESIPLVDHTVGSLLAERAEAHSDTIAVVGNPNGGGAALRLSYAALYERARRVAAGLAAITEPGDRVALWAPNVVEWPIIQYGAALAGVILVALNPVLREPELAYAIDHSRASVLIHAERSRAYEMAEVATAAVAACPHLRHVIALGERDRWQSETIDSDGDDRVPTDPEAAVMLQYTSGTTGAPKGVLLRHRAIVNVAKLTLERAGVEPGAVAVSPLPIFHTAGCVVSTIGPLWMAGTMILVEQFDPSTVLAQIAEEKATTLFYVPAVLGALLEAQRSSTDPAPTLHTVLGGASNVPPTMITDAKRVFGATVVNLFGQTELAPVLSATLPDDSPSDQLATVGRPAPQVDCAIIDPVSGDIQALGVEGEICARGYQQMIEYVHDPAATARAVDANGFLHTGDLGRMDERGYLTLTGRLKDLIIRGGENIAPAEVESCLCAHPDVIDAVVFGLPDERLGQAVAAAVRIRSEARPGLRSSLVEHTSERLSPFKVPARWYLADELPVTPTGKVQKFKLADLVEAGALPPLE